MFLTLQDSGSGCSRMAELTAHEREVVGSNPDRCLACFLFSINQQCAFNSGPSRRCNTTDFPIKICLAWQLEAHQAKYAQIEQKNLTGLGWKLGISSARLRHNWEFYWICPTSEYFEAVKKATRWASQKRNRRNENFGHLSVPLAPLLTAGGRARTSSLLSGSKPLRELNIELKPSLRIWFGKWI